jgi:hydroxymethylpyrimidine pyrophosphatase-like HAD family hydrolase
MSVRLIAVDLDETLLQTDKTICPNGALIMILAGLLKR